MKPSFPLTLLAVLGLAVSAPFIDCAHAGSAVAADEHGGFGYSYGDHPKEQLEHEAVRRCREKSKYPDDVHVVVSSRHGGAGIIVRYTVDGRQHVYAYVGAKSDQEAYNYATGYVEGYGGRKIEVVARWRD